MEEEISLRELIEILLRGKWIIAAITIIAILVSGIFSFFIISPTYEARTVIMASSLAPASMPTDEGNGYDALLNNLFKYPQMNIETYRVQITTPRLLGKVIQQLNLDTEKYSINSLKKSIDIETTKDTNLLHIVVKDKDPEMSAKISNALAAEFANFLSDSIREQMEDSAEYLKHQIQVEKENLEKATEELKNFIAQPQNVDELQKDIQAKLELITDFKTDLVQLDVQERAAKASLENAETRLEKEPRFLELERSIIDDPVMAGLTDNTAKNIAGLTLKTQEINDNYTTLYDKVAELDVTLAGVSSMKSAINENIKKTQAELETLQGILAYKQTEYDRLNEQYKLAQSTYNTFLQKYQEVRITTSTKIGDNNVMIISPAEVPEVPVSPRKALNVAIAAVLGIMISVFIVFFADYWKKSEDVL
ncbi:MAG TPA: hypothetical protein GXZ31_04765 [Thermoanaerobacterales bacterium]|nr:hypothetical protein [Thermoanaerobacterales bacterium]